MSLPNSKYRVGLVFSLIILILLLSTPQALSLTYYFSSSVGNDQYTQAQAQHSETPWRSLDRFNTLSPLLFAGDTVLFRRSDVFYGKIEIIATGSVLAPITFGAYDEGSNPVISALSTLTNWKHVGRGIYESDYAIGNQSPTIILDDVQMAMGRYPNKGYLTMEKHNDNLSITDDQLTSTINWTGAEVVIRKNRWTIDRCQITDQIGGTLSYTGGTKAIPTKGYGYFIQNSIKTLDVRGEWFHDAKRQKMFVFFGNTSPSLYSVKSATISTLVYINKSKNILFKDLDFVGAGANAFHIIFSENITLDGCLIELSGNEAVLASYSPYLTIKNSIIDRSLSGGIHLDVGCSNASILDNTIQNTGLMAGMGRSGTGTYEGITSFGDSTRVERNGILNTGYNGIYFGGNSSYVKNNLIDGFCITKDDGAGIYVGDWSKTFHKKIIENIIINGIGTGEGTNNPQQRAAEGIYIDDNSESVTVAGNTVALCSNGIKIHNATDINVFGNVVYNNGIQLRLEQDNYLITSSPLRDNIIRHNIFYSRKAPQMVAKLSSHQDDITSFGQLDSNMNNNTVRNPMGKESLSGARKVGNNFELAVSHEDQPKVPDADVLFEYNASSIERRITLKAGYSDLKNKPQGREITLKPYSSIILIGPKPKVASNTSNPR